MPRLRYRRYGGSYRGNEDGENPDDENTVERPRPTDRNDRSTNVAGVAEIEDVRADYCAERATDVGERGAGVHLQQKGHEWRVAAVRGLGL